MSDNSIAQSDDIPVLEEIAQGELVENLTSEDVFIEEISKGKNKKYTRFMMAALGSIPWVGSFIGAAASFSAEKDQEKINNILQLWFQEHEEKIGELKRTFIEIFSRLDNFGEEVEVQERIESPEYIALVRQAFKSWDQAETQEKRQMVKKLITNAGATTLCPDDLVQLFIKWIDQYHDSHFKVIKEIYQNPGSTRAQIWDRLNGGNRPRENSSEADLFRYLIRDLSTGGVIRQDRETNSYGEFVRRSAGSRTRNNGERIMESAFEDTKPYVLTELGKEFVHYVLTDVVQQVRSG